MLSIRGKKFSLTNNLKRNIKKINYKNKNLVKKIVALNNFNWKE